MTEKAFEESHGNQMMCRMEVGQLPQVLLKGYYTGAAVPGSVGCRPPHPWFVVYWSRHQS